MSGQVVDLNEKLLSISEAAKLLDVSENTLRDWDNDGKFKALRSDGGHRRYSLDQIRKHLDKSESEDEFINCVAGNKAIKEAVNNWKDSVFLDGAKSELEEVQLATLLENCRLMYKSNEEHLHDANFFTLDQYLWLTQQVFLRCRFRKMVSIQPMVGPADLVFYAKRKNSGYSIESDAVCAKTQKFETRIFTKGNFDSLKDVYADSLATELEYDIAKKLPRINTENFWKIGKAIKLSTLYDYIIAPKNLIENIKKNTDVTNVDLFDVAVILDPESFLPLACGGRYPTSNLQTPIFNPYILIMVSPALFLTRGVMTRLGWYEGDGLK